MRIARGRLKKPNVCCLRSRKRSLLAGGTTLSARGFRGALRSCIPHADSPRGWRECLYGGRICPHASIPGRDIPSALGDEGWGCVSSSGCGGVGAVTTARLSRRGKVGGEGWRTVKRPDQENQLCDKRFKRVGLNWT